MTSDSGEQEGKTIPAGESEPAFDFDNEMQHNIYVRDQSWQQLQDAMNFEVKRILAQYDLRDADLYKRELQDAMVRVAAQHPEEIARQVLEDRHIIDNDDELEL